MTSTFTSYLKNSLVPFTNSTIFHFRSVPGNFVTTDGMYPNMQNGYFEVFIGDFVIAGTILCYIAVHVLQTKTNLHPKYVRTKTSLRLRQIIWKAGTWGSFLHQQRRIILRTFAVLRPRTTEKVSNWIKLCLHITSHSVNTAQLTMSERSNQTHKSSNNIESMKRDYNSKWCL